MKLLLFFFTVKVIVTCGSADTTTTPAPGGQNLKGKMFTLNRYEGGLVLYSPSRPSPWMTTAQSDTTEDPTRSTTEDPTRSTTEVTTRSSTEDPTRSTTEDPTRSTTEDPTRSTTEVTTRSSTEDPTRSTTEDPTRSTTEDPTRSTTEDPTRSTTEDPTRSTTTTIPTTTKPTTTRPTTTKPTTTIPTTTKPTTTRPTTTKPTTTTYPWTTASPTSGVSVCLRYITDQQGVSIFTLSQYSTPLSLNAGGFSSFTLTFNSYNNLYLNTNTFWSNIKQKIWTSVCVTVDSRKGVTQVFKDSMMSPRKLIPSRYSWSGDPTIDFSGFEGQVTDVQVWDYPLSFREVFYFLTGGVYGPYRGSALSWSNIRYSVSGQTLLEDSYEPLMNLPVLRGEQKHYLKGEKKSPRKVFNLQKSKETRRRWF